jgi:hypothetical protein
MIEQRLSELSSITKKNLYYGKTCNIEDSLYLSLLKYAVLDCLEKKELIKYNDKIKLLTFDCKKSKNKVKVNLENKEKWEENNPFCINRKQWERIALKICKKYSLDIAIEPIIKYCNLNLEITPTINEVCSITFSNELLEKVCETSINIQQLDLICNLALDIVRNNIHCDVLTAISTQQKICELDIKNIRTKSECNIDYKLLVEKYENCNLEKNIYVELINKGFCYNTISVIYNNKLDISIDEDGDPILITPYNSYKIPKEFNFNNIVVTHQQDYKEIIDAILEDYNTSETIKKQLLNEIHFV